MDLALYLFSGPHVILMLLQLASVSFWHVLLILSAPSSSWYRKYIRIVFLCQVLRPATSPAGGTSAWFFFKGRPRPGHYMFWLHVKVLLFRDARSAQLAHKHTHMHAQTHVCACTYMYTHAHVHHMGLYLFLYLSVYIRNHEFTQILPIPLWQHKGHFTFVLFYIYNSSKTMGNLTPLTLIIFTYLINSPV